MKQINFRPNEEDEKNISILLKKLYSDSTTQVIRYALGTCANMKDSISTVIQERSEAKNIDKTEIVEESDEDDEKIVLQPGEFIGRDGKIYEDEFPIIPKNDKKVAQANMAKYVKPVVIEGISEKPIVMNARMEEILKEVPRSKDLEDKIQPNNGVIYNTNPENWEGRDVIYNDDGSIDTN